MPTWRREFRALRPLEGTAAARLRNDFGQNDYMLAVKVSATLRKVGQLFKQVFGTRLVRFFLIDRAQTQTDLSARRQNLAK